MNIRRAGLLAATAVAVVGLAGGCSLTPKPAAMPTVPPAATGSPSAAATGFPQVCDMFTDTDMTTLTKSKIASHKTDDKSTPTAPSCDWLSPDGGITTVIALAATTKAAFDGDAPSYTAVPGVGDGAYENHGILTVLHGDTTEISIIFGGAGEEDVTIQKAIATKVIEKLDGPSPSPSAS